MFHAILFICLLSNPDCEIDNAVYTIQSESVFHSIGECNTKMTDYFYRMGFPIELKESEDYQVFIVCDNK